MRFSFMLGALAGMSAAGHAASASLVAGKPVKDVQGQIVGTVVAVNGDTVTIRTSKHDVPVPLVGIGEDHGVLLIGMSAAQLDAAYEQSAAKVAAAANATLVPGAMVKGPQGAPIGKIDTIDDSIVVIALSDGVRISLPRSGIVATADGGLIGLTEPQLREQIAKSTANAK